MNAYLLPALGFTPGLIKRQFDNLPSTAVDLPTHLNRFSPREVLAHLADWEPIMLTRMQQSVNEPGSTIQPFDEVLMSIENGYAQVDPSIALERFESARKATIVWLKDLPREQWDSTANHPERGELSVYDWANLIVCHDVYHLEQLSAVK